MNKFFYFYLIIVLIFYIRYIKSIFYNVLNARVEQEKMATHFMAPPRIIFLIEVRRLA
jgi:hypothetical protein